MPSTRKPHAPAVASASCSTVGAAAPSAPSRHGPLEPYDLCVAGAEIPETSAAYSSEKPAVQDA